MEKDKLEKFITTNKSAFDTHEPSVDLWAKIESKLPEIVQETKVIELKNKGFLARLTTLPFWQIAAGIVLVLGLGF